MRRAVIAFLAVVVCPVLTFAQTGTQNSKLVIDQGAPDLATANSYTYRYYADGSTTGAILSMTCTGATSPFTCSAAMPAFTPGPHSVTLTAANVAGESPKSAAVSFTFVVIPSTPLNPRVQ